MRAEADIANKARSTHNPYMVAHVVPHDPEWKDAFFTEALAIKATFGTSSLELHHIGSTAVPGILAKPIIDLLGEVRDLSDAAPNFLATVH